jgi:hypothetical protein
MKTEEIQMLVAGLMSNGPEDTFNRMRAKAFMSMDQKDDVDEIFLDMSEALSERAKEDIESDSDENPSLSNIYSTLAFMLKRLAHEVHRKYIKKGEKRDNDRFLRLVSYNENVSLMI